MPRSTGAGRANIAQNRTSRVRFNQPGEVLGLGWQRLLCQADHFAGAFIALEGEQVQDHWVGTGLEFGRIHAQGGQGFRPYTQAKFSILSASAFVVCGPIRIVYYREVFRRDKRYYLHEYTLLIFALPLHRKSPAI
jgi:hypothetical protein